MNKLSNTIVKDSVVLYRHDGLGVFGNLPGLQIEREKKNVIKVFKKYGLSKIVTRNIISIDFLYVTFNLKTESYEPFRKPNNEPKYIDINPNDCP